MFTVAVPSPPLSVTSMHKIISHRYARREHLYEQVSSVSANVRTSRQLPFGVCHQTSIHTAPLRQLFVALHVDHPFITLKRNNTNVVHELPYARSTKVCYPLFPVRWVQDEPPKQHVFSLLPPPSRTNHLTKPMLLPKTAYYLPAWLLS